MDILFFETILVWSSVVAQLAIIANLFRHKLLARYWAFLMMLAIGVARDSSLIFLDHDTPTYCIVWAMTLFPWLLAQIVTALFAYFALAKCYRGIGRFAGWLYLSSVAFGCLVCFFVYGRATVAYFSYVAFAQSAEMSAALVLVSSTILVTAFLRRFPSPFRRMPSNLIGHLGSLACFFGITSVFEVTLNVIDAEPTRMRSVEIIYAVCINLCYVLWATRLNREGESSLRWLGMEPSTREKIRNVNAGLIRIAKELS